ncbi:arylesterase [Solimonas marina]|uniref:Arylesterase n=1 Tax=Solimonas marina TaxID=2714601 RepID=A0A970B7J4_9GAMM|nr:arylesterase [Solimonas marina]NKF21264.1 arylesterase [Solimonas marina]
MLKRFLFCVLLLGCAIPALATAADGKPPVWLVLGDSLSAAYGIPQSQGWVALLQQRLSDRGYRAQVINASVSGETTSGGLARLPALLARHQPQVVLIELGGNDGLRALPIKIMRQNLQRLVDLSRQAGARTAIFQMQLPPNYGPTYVTEFADSYPLLAKRNDIALVPFLLAPIATDRDAFQADGIHPLATSEPKVLDAIWPALEKLATR